MSHFLPLSRAKTSTPPFHLPFVAMPFHPVRSTLYILLFMSSAVLLGLTCKRVNYTEKMKHPDILSTKTHFYNAIIVELLVTSSFAIIWSLWMLSVLLARLGRGPLSNYGSELVGLIIIWVMFIVGAAITTHKWSNLKWCRGHFRPCRILETIKAMGWICWGFTTFLILASLWNMKRNNHDFTGPAHGRRDYTGTYPETRDTAARPVTAA
ncbi:hypothetical protein BDQ12DRAFT_753354 [Crucibulum laeve]|uniref:MARVEL domain-containing protein n=1 Tax=Crucibulum laeve TaxID=68775 RepID=A0A5C3LXK3_9AGAR|nr:hypothetical protein BDQ12DRAFT_753354 [Crucibulum laeve]